jgi:hypothetical protein
MKIFINIVLIIFIFSGCSKWDLERNNPLDGLISLTDGYYVQNANSPKVNTLEVKDISYNSIKVVCNLEFLGNSQIDLLGVCYSKDSMPNISDSIIKIYEYNKGIYELSINNLDHNQEYYVRAVAKNKNGIAYGKQVKISTTRNLELPLVEIKSINMILNEVKVISEVTNQGTSSVTESGICWNKTNFPDLNDFKVISGIGNGQFYSKINNLNRIDTIYIRAYAKNQKGISYSSVKKILPNFPSVSTNLISVGNNFSEFKGAYTSSSIISKGFALYTYSDSFDINNHYLVSTSNFDIKFTNLFPNKQYFVRAYIQVDDGYSYGNEISIVTKSTPSISLNSLNLSSTNLVSAEATIMSDGGSSITRKGFCYSLSSSPTINSSVLIINNSNTIINGNINSLIENAKYYIRAFAENIYGISYSNELIVTAYGKPIVTLNSLSSINSSSSFTSNSEVLSNGNLSLVNKGICYSSSTSTPTISSNVIYNNSSLNSYTTTVNSLYYGTTYYVRAFASNDIGTSYSSTMSVVPIGIPSISTNSVSYTNGNTFANSGGTNIIINGSSIIDKGVCYSTSPNPTINNSKVSASPQTGSSSFSVSLSGLNNNFITYYARAYATNSAGTGYGNQVQFQTSYNLTSPTLSSPSDNIQHILSISNPIVLIWDCVNGANSYEVQFSNNSSFTGTTGSLPISPNGNLAIDNNQRIFSSILSSNCSSNKQSVSIGNSCSNCSALSFKNFYWRVRAINGSFQSSWSSTRIIQIRK